MIRRLSIFLLTLLLGLSGSALSAREPDVPYRNNLKATVLSLLSGSVKLTWERAMADDRSLELTGGIIGWGEDWLLNINHSKGALARLSYKFIFHRHPGLQGFYVKPELAYSTFFYDAKATEERLRTDRLAVMGCFGYQVVYRRFVFDVFSGLGYGFGSGNEYNYYHGYIGLGPSSHVALTSGFKLGVAF